MYIIILHFVTKFGVSRSKNLDLDPENPIFRRKSQFAENQIFEILSLRKTIELFYFFMDFDAVFGISCGRSVDP